MLDKKNKISNRKKDHLEICLNSDVNYSKSNGFEKYEFLHDPLTEVSIDKIDFSLKFLGKNISFPFLISSMTGGTKAAYSLNEKLAVVADELNIPMGLGSMRTILEDESQIETFKIVREVARQVPILSNIGAGQIVQLKDLLELEKIIAPIDADGLIIHLNPLQELLQTEGDSSFKGILKKIEEIKRKIDIPLVVKEVGAGIDFRTAKRLLDVGVDVIDVAGAGGTSWAAVELMRNDVEGNYPLREWGFRTSYAIRETAGLKSEKSFILIGSGGIKTFEEAAKAFALGADMVASAQNVLSILDKSDIKGVIEFITNLFIGIKKIMFLTGSNSISELQKNKILRSEELF